MKAFVLSMLPNDIHMFRSYGMRTIYGCAEGEVYRVTTIEDSTDRMDIGSGNSLPSPVAAPDIAKDAEVNATVDGPNGTKWPLAIVIDNAEPTANELQRLRDTQDDYWRHMLKVGDKAWARTRRYEDIDDNSKRAAVMLGEDREWAQDVQSKDECFACHKRVMKGIARCPECTAILDIDKAYIAGIINKEQADDLKERRGLKKAKRETVNA